jgi:hypothetical protein
MQAPTPDLTFVNVKPPTVFSGSEVYKLTMFVTKAQWEAISAWSAKLPIDEDSDDGGSWLYMQHEVNKADEYKQTMSEMIERVKGGGSIVYTTAN